MAVFPRTYGDEPITVFVVNLLELVFPVPTGMNRYFVFCFTVIERVPRTYGDEPGHVRPIGP